MTGAPIDERDFVSGVTVVDIGDVRVARGMARRHHGSCPHRQMVFDRAERRIWCKDCEHTIEAFDAFELIVRNFSAAERRIADRERELKESEAFKARALATKKLDAAWRRRKVVPCCPHCRQALFPEDFVAGQHVIGREFAEAQRRRIKT
jgi:hypothetical protein